MPTKVKKIKKIVHKYNDNHWNGHECDIDAAATFRPVKGCFVPLCCSKEWKNVNCVECKKKERKTFKSLAKDMKKLRKRKNAKLQK